MPERSRSRSRGRSPSALGEIAREFGVWLVPGLGLRASDGRPIHNTCARVLARRASSSLATARSFRGSRTRNARPGAEFVTFEIPDVGRVGLAICYDGTFPETFRQLAWMGAEVVIQPTLTTTSDRTLELVLARANAIANQLYVVSRSTPPRRRRLGRSVDRRP